VARTICWLARVYEIRRSVQESVRSHYRRQDIERIFQIQPRAAQHIMRAVTPSTRIGQAYLVAREDLAAFLDRIAASNDPDSLLFRRPRPGRGLVLRDFLQGDELPATLESVPGNVSLQRGPDGHQF
jgi:hypothetical protein